MTVIHTINSLRRDGGGPSRSVAALCSNVVLAAKRAGVPSAVFPSGGLPGLRAEALRAGLRRYIGMEQASWPRRRRRAARGCLGIVEEAFAQAWEQTFAETR